MADGVAGVAVLDPETMTVTSGETTQVPGPEAVGISNEDPEDMELLKSFYGDLLQVDGEPVVSATNEPASDVPAVETKVETPVETVETPAAEVLTDELRQMAEFGRQWQDAFKNDPQAAIAHLVQSDVFTPETRGALLDQIQKAQAPPPIALDQYEAQSDFERALLPSLPWLRDGHKEVSEAFAVRDKDIQHTYAEAAGAHALLEGICEVLDIKMPKFSAQEALAHYDKAPEGTLLDSVNKVYREAVMTAARAEKQKRAERPVTLRNQAPAVASDHKINNLEDAWNEAGRQLGMEA